MRQAVVMVASACLLAAPALATTHTVTQTGLTFSPANLTVVEGDTVEWVWTGGVHTVTSGSPCTSSGLFDLPLTSGSPLASFTFNSAGTFDYFCTPHCGLNMTGVIEVQAGTTVPTVSEWGMMTLALLTLIGGTLVIRRQMMSSTAIA